MRKTMIIVNGVTALFFIAFFAYTFFARQQIDNVAREFLTEKTQEYAKPVVEFADKTLKNRIVRALLSAEQIAAFESEIVAYRRDPQQYIGQLTGQRVPAAMQNVKNPLLLKLIKWKDNVRAYYDKALQELIWDLRIFAGSNIIAASIGAWIAYHARDKISKRLVVMSFLLISTIVFCVFMYIDSMSFFSILTRSHLGWWYPVLLIGVFIGLYRLERGDPPIPI